MIDVEEKIKQAFLEDTCVIYGKRSHWRYDGPDYARTRCESIIELYEEKTLPAIQESVLKILEDYENANVGLFDRMGKILDFKDIQIEKMKQKLKELADLLKNRPRLNDPKYVDMMKTQAYEELRICKHFIIDFTKWFEIYGKKFVEAFDVESVKPTKKEVSK